MGQIVEKSENLQDDLDEFARGSYVADENQN